MGREDQGVPLDQGDLEGQVGPGDLPNTTDQIMLHTNITRCYNMLHTNITLCSAVRGVVLRDNSEPS